VIPAYNATTTLDETLRSVQSQTYLTLEIIVVNEPPRAYRRLHFLRDGMDSSPS